MNFQPIIEDWIILEQIQGFIQFLEEEREKVKIKGKEREKEENKNKKLSINLSSNLFLIFLNICI